MTLRQKKSSKKVRGRYAKYFASWVLQDFNMCPQKFGMMIRSPPFVVGLLGGTKWSLIFYPRGDASPSPERDFMAFYLQREEHSNKIDSVLVDFELRFITHGWLGQQVIRRRSFQEIYFKELDRHGEQKFFKIKQRSLSNVEIFEDEEIESLTERRRGPRMPEVRKRKPTAVKQDVFSLTKIELECSITFKEDRKITSKNNNRDIDLLSSDLRRMYNKKYLVDLDITCGNQVFGVHRAILSARCPKLLKCLVFENCEGISRKAMLFYTPNKVFRCLLIYIYTGRLETPLYNIRSKLYKIAYFLEMEDLIQLLDSFPDCSKFTTTFQTGKYEMALEIGWTNLTRVTKITRVFPSEFKYFKRLIMVCKITHLETDIKERWGIAKRDLEKGDLLKKDPPQKEFFARHRYSLSFRFYITGQEEYEHLSVLRCKISLKKPSGDNPFKIVDRRYSFKRDGSWQGNNKVSTKIYVDEGQLEMDSNSIASDHLKLEMKCVFFISDVTYSEAENMVQDIFLPCKLSNLDYNAGENYVTGKRYEPGKGVVDDINWGADGNSGFSATWAGIDSNNDAAVTRDCPEANDSTASGYMLPTEDSRDDPDTSHTDDGAESDEGNAGVADDMPSDDFIPDCDVYALEDIDDKEADSTAVGQNDEEAASTAIGEGAVKEDGTVVTAAGESDDETAPSVAGKDYKEDVSITSGESDDDEEADATTIGEGNANEDETAVTAAGEGDETAPNVVGESDDIDAVSTADGESDDKDAVSTADGESDDKDAVSTADGESDDSDAVSTATVESNDSDAVSTAAGERDYKAAATAIGEGDVNEEAAAIGEGDVNEEAAATAIGEGDVNEEAAATAIGEGDVNEEASATAIGEGDDETAPNAAGEDDYKEAVSTTAGESDEKEANSSTAGKGDESTSYKGGAVTTQRRSWSVVTLKECVRKRYKYSPLQLSTSLLGLKVSGAYNDFSVLAEEHEFGVHKAILGFRSQYFRRKFNENAANYTCDKCGELSPTTVDLLLSYLYSGVIGDLSNDERVKLRKAADKYGIGHLQNKCDSFSE